MHSPPDTPQEAKSGRWRVGLRDVAITLAIALLIVGIVFVVNRRSGQAEGSTTDINRYTGGLPAGPAPAVGSPAPGFQLPLLNGGTFRLSDYRGRYVWINFWATWCPPCRAEMPDIEKVWKEEQGGDLVLVAVDFGEDRATVDAFIKKLGLTFPVALDSSGQLTTNYRVVGLPTHFFIDKDGILREIRIGLMSEASMRDKLARLRGY
jgi:peroxiredoxin